MKKSIGEILVFKIIIIVEMERISIGILLHE